MNKKAAAASAGRTIIGIAAVLFGYWAYKKNKGISGIGAAKRRIYKEISLAQQAGVDFTKKYDELSEDEIEALQRVSNDTGFTETYYKGLKKAYDAVSGIGEAYDVADENGNTVLTWIEDPEVQVSRTREIEEARQRTLEAEERAAKARKSKQATNRRLTQQPGQMALFGCGYIPEVEHELYEIWREQIEYGETDYNYDTWRVLVGDDYAKQYVLPYM